MDAVLQAPPPTDLPKLRTFLGLTSWYLKFIPDYAAVIEPLRALLHGTDAFTRTPEAQRSFEAGKGLIINSPTLSLFNPELPTVVTTDASDYGLGAVLTQIHQEGTMELLLLHRACSPRQRENTPLLKRRPWGACGPQKSRELTYGEESSHYVPNPALSQHCLPQKVKVKQACGYPGGHPDCCRSTTTSSTSRVERM